MLERAQETYLLDLVGDMLYRSSRDHQAMISCSCSRGEGGGACQSNEKMRVRPHDGRITRPGLACTNEGDAIESLADRLRF